MRSLALAAFLLPTFALAGVTTPKAFLGHDVCADYRLADYSQLTGYWRRLASESDRIRIVEIGKTEFGRPQLMAIVSDPANLRNLERHRRTSERFARGDFKSEAEALTAAKGAKPVVWIDGGLHANEVLGSQQLIETAYRLVSGEDEETRRIRRDVITLIVHANPDGHDLVTKWYMRRSDPETRSLSGLPELYEKYAGHDNNRDFYAANLAETRNMNRVMYREWYPQIVYNHHQSAPSGTIMYVPPFRNPFNHNVDAVVQNSTDLIGTLILSRLIGEGKGGTVSRDAASFSSWWNGGLRTTAYFHNMVGILTETWGSPNPTEVPFLKSRQVPIADLPLPVEPKLWHLRDSLEYEQSANAAILDYASRYCERLLLTTYRAARNSIERGRRDSWTRYPSRIEEFEDEAVTRPELRDARAYVLPANAKDPGAVRLFLDRLRDTGVEVRKAQKDGPGFRSSDYVILCDQPFRPHILDMFEPQDHPNDFRYPGGPPIAPYDAAGYTLAFQMGVPFVRVLDGKDVPATTPYRPAAETRESGALTIAGDATESYRTVALALAKGMSVRRFSDGAFEIDAKDLPIDPETIRRVVAPTGAAKKIRAPKIALLDEYGGSMPSGWTRWFLDRFNLSYTVVYPSTIESGALEGFDVLLVPSGIADEKSPEPRPFPYAGEPGVGPEIAARWGAYSAARTGAKIRAFVEGGGHLVAWGEGTDVLAEGIGAGVKSAVAGLKRSEYFIPASVLRVGLKESGLTRGMDRTLDVIMDDSPVFEPLPSFRGETVAAWNEERPLRSGWAWGQERLRGHVAIVDCPIGRGKALFSGPELNYRGQSYGSFRILLAAIFRAAER